MSYKILVVDDEESILKLVQSRLTAGGYQVFTASNGEEGIAKAKTLRPDVIVLDVLMPVMDGPQMAEALKDYPETKDIPVIFLTCLVKDNEVKRDHLIGGHIFLAKPFKAEELQKMLKSVLEKKGKHE